MADCYDSEDYENDSKVRFVSDVHNFKLKNLTFSKYDNEDKIKWNNKYLRFWYLKRFCWI